MKKKEGKIRWDFSYNLAKLTNKTDNLHARLQVSRRGKIGGGGVKRGGNMKGPQKGAGKGISPKKGRTRFRG